MTSGITLSQYRLYWPPNTNGNSIADMTKNPRKQPPADWQKADAARLKAIYLQKKPVLGLTQEKLAEALGTPDDPVTQGAVSHFLNGRTQLSIRTASIFARELGVSVADFSPELASRIEELGRSAGLGKTEEIDDDSYDLIPVTTAKAAAGLGYVNTHIERRDQWPFKRSWLKANSLKPESLVIITADGESMQPTIFDQDKILVDLSRKEPENGHVFVLNSPAEGVIVKRIYATGFGGWVVSSDNPDKEQFPTRYPRKDDGTDLQIVGRVVWRGGEL